MSMCDARSGLGRNAFLSTEMTLLTSSATMPTWRWPTTTITITVRRSKVGSNSPKRMRRSNTGTTVPRRLITPST
jgi:hypothetical protein